MVDMEKELLLRFLENDEKVLLCNEEEKFEISLSITAAKHFSPVLKTALKTPVNQAVANKVEISSSKDDNERDEKNGFLATKDEDLTKDNDNIIEMINDMSSLNLSATNPTSSELLELNVPPEEKNKPIEDGLEQNKDSNQALDNSGVSDVASNTVGLEGIKFRFNPDTEPTEFVNYNFTISTPKRINVMGFSKQTVEQFVEFLHGNALKVELNWKTLVPLLKMSHFYNVENALRDIVHQGESLITSVNLLEAISLVDIYEIDEWQDKCTDVLKETQWITPGEWEIVMGKHPKTMSHLFASYLNKTMNIFAALVNNKLKGRR